jgi:hypothetical protein
MWRLVSERALKNNPPTSSPGEAGADAMPSDLLTEFGKHVGWELSYAGWDDEAEWQVHQVNGGRNDREWTLIGTGQTPAAAIRAALSETRP